jgi:uncharacterized membrane protein
MSNSPEPLNKKSLTRASVFGVSLSVLGVVAFVALWVLLGSAGFDNLPRLLLSMCIPPLLIAIIVAVYGLNRRGGTS